MLLETMFVVLAVISVVACTVAGIMAVKAQAEEAEADKAYHETLRRTGLSF